MKNPLCKCGRERDIAGSKCRACRNAYAREYEQSKRDLKKASISKGIAMAARLRKIEKLMEVRRGKH